MLSEDEGRPAGGAALLRVGVGEQRAFLREAIDVGRAVTHDAVVVGADVVDADVVAPDDEDVRLACFCLCHCAAPFSVVGCGSMKIATAVLITSHRSLPITLSSGMHSHFAACR